MDNPLANSKFNDKELLEEVASYIADNFEEADFVFSPIKCASFFGSNPHESLTLGDGVVGSTSLAEADEVQDDELVALADEFHSDDGACCFASSLESPSTIEEALAQRDTTFSEALFNEIDCRKLTDPEVYKRANIDRKLFSKIRSNADYQPKKSTALSLALALQMNLDETLDFIGRAGYTLSNSSKADLIITFFIEKQCWDINLINQVLHEFKQPILCC